MRRLKSGIIAGARGIEDCLQFGAKRYRAAMVTLTYRPGVTYSPRQISASLKLLEQWARVRGHFVYYVWRLEFGSRTGRLHYHVLVWLPKGATMPLWDKRGWWPHGMTNAEWARSPIGYIAKYAGKQATFVGETSFNTKGARWWGGRFPPQTRFQIRLCTAPGWVQKKFDQIGGSLKRLPFGWWRIGDWEFRSPWELVRFDVGEAVIRWRGWGANDFELAEVGYGS